MSRHKPKNTTATPLSRQDYMDRLRAIWQMAIALKNEATLTMVRRSLTGTFKAKLKDNALEFDRFPTYNDNQEVILPRFARKVVNLENKFNEARLEVKQISQQGNTNAGEQAAVAK